MGRTTREDLELVTIRLSRGDKDKLTDFYPRIGYNKAVRLLVRKHVKMLEERLNEATPNISIKEDVLNDE